MAKILQKEEKILREKAKEVPASLFGSKELATYLKEMSAALAKCDDGVALAGPQIGIPYRIFIIAGKVFSDPEEKPGPDLVFINPVITKISKKKVKMEEGCLSVRWFYGQVKRADKATVEAYNEKGKKFSRSGSGLFAQIFQHEIDHLDGVLFIDKATNLEEYKPEKIPDSSKL